MSELWEKQEYETAEEFKAFQFFRDQIPPRRQMPTTHAPLAELHRWSMRNHWKVRVTAMDAYLDKAMLEEKEAVFRQTSKEVAVEHMTILARSRNIVLRELNEMMTRAPGTLRMADLNKLIENTIKYDRLVRGEATEVVATVDLSRMTPEELDMYEKLTEKALSGEEDTSSLQ